MSLDGWVCLRVLVPLRSSDLEALFDGGYLPAQVSADISHYLQMAGRGAEPRGSRPSG
jgi:hypothetical protein